MTSNSPKSKKLAEDISLVVVKSPSKVLCPSYTPKDPLASLSSNLALQFILSYVKTMLTFISCIE